jgi:hypothetical protein
MRMNTRFLQSLTSGIFSRLPLLTQVCDVQMTGVRSLIAFFTGARNVGSGLDSVANSWDNFTAILTVEFYRYKNIVRIVILRKTKVILRKNHGQRK